MNRWEDWDEPLNNSVPYDTIIRVLLKKIKIQEKEIENLRMELEEPCALIEGISENEAEKLKANPFYRVLMSDFRKVEKRLAKAKEDELRLINKLAVATKIVDDYFS